MTNKKPKQLIKQQNSVPKYLGFVRYSLAGTVVKSCPNGINGCSSFIELGAQHVSPHRRTIKRKEDHTWKACACLSVATNVQKLKLQRKNEVSGSSEQLHSDIQAFGEEPWDQRTSGTSQRWCRTVRPTVALYLNELPD